MSILLIARHYPPAISGGARRPSLLVSGLRDAGADVFVAAPSLPEGERGVAVPHPHRDPAGAGPASASVPMRALSLRAVAREVLLWPDPDIRWAMRAARIAAATVPFRPDWILTTSPPESLHIAGAWLKRRLGAFWAADFRDTWLDRPHRIERRSPFRRIGEALQARLTLGQADLITAVDPVVAQDAERLGGRNVCVLPHFSPDSLPRAITLSQDELHVVHAGSIELSDPESRIEDLIQVFSAARQRNARLRLHLIGRLSAREQALARLEGVTLHGPKPYDETLSYIAGADALALVASRKMHVPPSKIVDYLATDKPIVACGDGPWRSDPRTPRTDAEDTLARLVKGMTRSETPPLPQTAREAAKALLDMLQERSSPAHKRRPA